ncbi:MAG TPA: GntR family transcriptional regulator [Variovorax sp.]|nr:GntR family transcriptional regulator [Variovorax sp.]
MNPGTASLAGLPKVTPSANLPSHVQAVLQEAILNGALAPGERLFVDEVAAHFGVSKIPIREALKALETAGWVQSQPRRGTYVRPLSREELRETFEMRRLLEPYSAALAAKRRTDVQLAELKGLLAQSAVALKAGDVIALTDTNSRFHSTMGDAAGNKMLSESIAKLELQLRRYFVSVEWQQRRESMAQHKAIFEAIRDQDTKLAERLTLAHIDHTESLASASIDATPNALELGLS